MPFSGDESVRQFIRPEVHIMGTPWVGKTHDAWREELLKQVRAVDSCSLSSVFAHASPTPYFCETLSWPLTLYAFLQGGT